MTLLSLLENLFKYIGIFSTLLTIISYFLPTETYPIVKWIRNKFNRRLFYKQNLTIKLYKNYYCDEISHQELKKVLKSKFYKYDIISEYENGVISAKLNRMNFNIMLKIDDPSIHEEYILIKQVAEVKFKELSELINVMFDLYDDFEKLDYLKEYDDKINFIIGSDKFTNNKFIKEFGDNINFKDFAVTKFKDNYELNITAVNNQESIKKVNNIIIEFIEI